MYEFPIEIFRAVDDIIKQVNEGTDKMVCEAVIKCGVNVNKDELIKALQYDRAQYVKGYNDGIKEILLTLEAEAESSDKYIREYDDSREQKAYNQALWKAYNLVKEMVGESSEDSN